jgi:hypothetical protein
MPRSDVSRAFSVLAWASLFGFLGVLFVRFLRGRCDSIVFRFLGARDSPPRPWGTVRPQRLVPLGALRSCHSLLP